MDKKNIAVLFGGRSCEHEISIITGLQLIEFLDTTKFNPIPVYVARDGHWYTGERLLKREIYKDFENKKNTFNEVVLYPFLGERGLTVIKKCCIFGEKFIPIDVFFPAFHGEFGEDGCIQGLFELAGVPYTGSQLLASAISMSKNTAKMIASLCDVPVLDSVNVFKEDMLKNGIESAKKDVLTKLKYPVFIKPNNLGSSVGVSKAMNDEELFAGLAKVFVRDKEAIVEPFLDNMFEINISILDTKDGLVASAVEIPVPDGEFLSYEDKYLREGKGKKKGGTPKKSQGMASLTRSIDPQNLSDDIKEKVTEYAKKAFKAFKASGAGRLDFMFNKETGTIYFNEFNPLPGSLSFYLWEKSKPEMLYTEELTKIIERAEELFEIKQGLDKDLGFHAL